MIAVTVAAGFGGTGRRRVYLRKKPSAARNFAKERFDYVWSTLIANECPDTNKSGRAYRNNPGTLVAFGAISACRPVERR
jgi:hypothetical protein